MVYTEYAKVKNVLTVNTKYGKRRVCNVVTKKNGDEAIWAEDLSSFSHIKAGTTIEVIRGVKGGLTILEKSAPAPTSYQFAKVTREIKHFESNPTQLKK